MLMKTNSLELVLFMTHSCTFHYFVHSECATVQMQMSLKVQTGLKENIPLGTQVDPSLFRVMVLVAFTVTTFVPIFALSSTLSSIG